MKIRKFIVNNLNEAKSKIIEELGENAVLLSSRNIVLPSTNEKRLEVVAGIDENIQTKPKEIKQERSENINRKLLETNAPPLPANSHLNILAEINVLKEMISEISESTKYKHSYSLSPVFSNLYKALIDDEFQDDTALNIIAKISTEDINISETNAFKKARQIISEMFSYVNPLEKLSKPTKAIFFGPTGSGKTSTLIKFAIVAKLLHQLKILIISTDTYKVSGAEQLQTFAALASLPFRTAYTSEELENIYKNEEYDLFLIDTTGRSPNNQEHIKQIKQFVDITAPQYKFMVQNSNSSAKSFENVIKGFSILKPNSVILTKLDEVTAIGASLSLLKKYSLPLSFVTNGQQIPEDFELANQNILSKFVLK